MSSQKSILSLFLTIAILHTFATLNHWYWIYRWFDIPMHILGGIWVTMIFFWILETHFPKFWNFLSNEEGGEKILTLVLAVSFAVLIGVFWEFFEFLFDLFFSKAGYRGEFQMLFYGVKDLYVDTLKDLFFDLAGGITFAILKLKKIK